MDGTAPRSQITRLLALSGQGDRTASERLLAIYRPYLRLAIGSRLPKFFHRRVDGSDIVQHTLIDAQRGLPDFRGGTEGELTAWMVKLLERNLLQSIRQNTAEKRDVRREVQERMGDSSAQLVWHAIACDGSTPQSSVFQGEAALLLAQALEQLPLDQRTAIEMRYLGQQSLRDIADQMQRSVSSVAGLIRRGVEALQTHLPAELGELT